MTARTTVAAVLEEARELGFLGPGPVEAHVEHATGFAAAVPLPPAHALDLGSGGGVPGLILAERWASSRWVLLDSHQRRTTFLADAVERLGWAPRVRVVRARAEDLGHDAAHRGRYDLVTARSFAPPGVTAECGAAFLRVGGWLVVSEPPDALDRWPEHGLACFGLARDANDGRFAVLRQAQPCPPQYPRRVGIPAKRPRF